MRVLLCLIVCGWTGAALAQLSPDFYEAIRTVIVSRDFVCEQVDKIIGPTMTPQGRELSVHCGDFRYIVTITPSNHFLVRVR